MKVISFLILIFSVFVLGCKENSPNLKIEGTYRIISIRDSLKVMNSDSFRYLSGVKEIFQIGKDSLLVIPDKDNVFYITNNDLEIIDIHNFKNNEFMIKPPIMGTALYNNEVYFVDMSFVVKKYNIQTRIVRALPLMNRANNMLDVYNDSTIIGTEQMIEYPALVYGNGRPFKDENKILIGTKSKGKTFAGVPIYAEKEDYGDFSFVKAEIAYSRVFKDKMYYIFNLSKKVMIYDIEGKFLNSAELLVDDSYYKTPSESYMNGRKGISFSELTSQPLVPYNNYLTHLFRSESGKNPEIICYDLEFRPIAKYQIDNEKNGNVSFIRRYWFCNNKLYTTNGFNGITVFEMVRNNDEAK